MTPTLLQAAEESLVYVIVTDVSNLLVILQSATNCLIYLKWRADFVKRFTLPSPSCLAKRIVRGLQDA